MDKIKQEGLTKNPFKKLLRKIRNNYSLMERKDFPFVIAFLAYPVIQIALFYFYVNISSFVMAFQDATTGSLTFANIKAVLVAFENNQDIWGNPITTMLLKSVLIWVVGTAMTPVSWLTCYILTKHIPGSNFFRAMYAVPGLVGTVVFSTIIKDFFAWDGIVTKFLINCGVDFPIQVIRNGLLGSEETAFLSLLIQSQLYGIAGGGMILAGAYMRIPSELFESANLDGCGFFRETFSIAIPCVWTTLSTMLIFSLCGIFTADLGMYVYSNGTGNYGLNSMGYYIYSFTVNIASGGGMELYHYLSAVGMLITVITLPLVFLGRWVVSKISDSVEF